LQSPDIEDIILKMDIIHQDELKVLASLGTAIWADPDLSEQNVLDTVSAASLFGLTPERTLEKACQGLLEKAKGQSAHTAWIQNPSLFKRIFYRLSPEERFILTAVHLGHWTYDRLVGVLDRNREKVQEVLWQARLAMNEGAAPYPAGPAFSGPNCPEYNPRMPWTQKFLDNDIQGKDRFFLSQHMLACSSCAGTMARCRVLYFKVDQELAKNIGVPEFGYSLKNVLEQSPLHRYSSELSVRESLGIFLRKPDVRFILYIFLGLLLFRLIKLAAFTTSV
jgi:hypothetical protein